MEILVGLFILFPLCLLIWRDQKQKEKARRMNARLSIELDQIQAKIRVKQEQEEIRQAELLGREQERIRQAELLSQEQERIRQAKLLKREQERIRQAELLSQEQEQQRIRRAELLSQVQEGIRQAELLRREQEGIRQAELLSQEQEGIRQAELLNQVQEQIRQAELLRQETKSRIDQEAITKQEQAQIQKIELLISQAKSAIAQDTAAYSPFDTKLLLAAIEYYHQSYLLTNKDSYLQLIDGLQIEIDRRNEFKSLFRIATKYFYDKYFGLALTNLLLAQKLYSPPQLLKTIDECEELAKGEKSYLTALAEAKKLSYAGKFSDALSVVVLATTKFSRQDGDDLQVKLNRVIAATEQLNLGNTQQTLGDITAAKYHYSAAIHLVPGWKEPQLQLAMIEAQTGETGAAIDRLAIIDHLQARCLEGLLHTQLGAYQQAREIWSKLDQDLMREYWQLISNQTIAQCRLVQPQIRALVDQGELDQAKTLSIEFIAQFGSDSLIETNLKNCIVPGIETKIWQTEDWLKITTLTHENWLTQPSIKSLHNWTVALYYASQIDDDIEKLLIALPTAIANLSLDPILQNIPWLVGKSPSLNDLSDQLWQILDLRIEAIKDSDLPKYLDLRDCYRREFWAMQLAQEQPDTKVVLGELIILPACFQSYYSQFSLGEELKVWKTLYTKWGKAVAACLAGDPQRAEVIKADLEINSNLEEFASQFISYKQGYYYLQQEDWRGAVYPLNLAKTAIINNDQWHSEIDQLCINHRRKIFDFQEHLYFSQFWHVLLSSNQSETYFVEYQALQIHSNWSQALSSDTDSFREIQDLRDNYPLHPVVQAIFTQIHEHCFPAVSKVSTPRQIGFRDNLSDQ